MNIRQNLVPPEKYSIKCPYKMQPIGICVHNTANDASAENEIAYMIRNDNYTSYHYAIDDREIVQGITEDRNGFHAGDGAYGDGNRKYIGIEICYSKSGGEKFIQAEKNAARFIAAKLKEYGWGTENVKKHQDFDGKYCPHRTLDMGWQRFLDMINKEMEEEELTKDEVQAMIDASKEKVYHYWTELPEWAYDPVYALYKAGYFVGNNPGDLDLSYGTMRTLVVLARALKKDGKITF